MGFSRKEHWSGLPCPLPGDLPNPGIEPRSPTFLGCFFNDRGSPRYAATSTLMAEREKVLKDLMMNLWDKSPLIMQCDSFNALLHLVLVFC